MIKYIFEKEFLAVNEVNAGKSVRFISRKQNIEENEILE